LPAYLHWSNTALLAKPVRVLHLMMIKNAGASNLYAVAHECNHAAPVPVVCLCVRDSSFSSCRPLRCSKGRRFQARRQRKERHRRSEGCGSGVERRRTAVNTRDNWKPQVAGYVVGQPLPFPVLIADRRNNRLIEIAPDKRIVWEFSSPNLAVYSGNEDVNFSEDGSQLAVSEEDSYDVHIVDYEKRELT
jgi:hypothetical protein